MDYPNVKKYPGRYTCKELGCMMRDYSHVNSIGSVYLNKKIKEKSNKAM